MQGVVLSLSAVEGLSVVSDPEISMFDASNCKLSELLACQRCGMKSRFLRLLSSFS